MAEALRVVSPPEREELRLTAGGKPVKESPEIAGLYPKRGQEALQELKVSILANGQDGRCLFLDHGDHYLVVDGHDTCRAAANLRREGREVEVGFDLYQPRATAPEEVLLEVMAVAVRRKNLQTAQRLGEGDKKEAILRYLVACSVHGVHRTAAWVAEDLGCSRPWVTKVREQAIEEGRLPRVEHYLTRAGTYQRSEFYKAPFTVVRDIEGQAGDTVLEEEEEAKAAERAEAEARNQAQKEAGAARAEDDVDQPDVGHPDADAHQPDAETEGFGGGLAFLEDLGRDAARFAEEMAILNRWNAQRPKPFTPDQLEFLWAADLVDPDQEEVRLLVDRHRLEARLTDLLTPVLDDVGISPDKVKRSLQNLLKTK
jgi:hypothetical protein